MTHEDSVEEAAQEPGLVGGPGADRDPGRRPSPVGDRARRPHVRTRPSHLTDGLANTAMMMHLAAASLGLGSQHTTIHIEDPFKRVLGVPDLLTFNLIMPIGYPDAVRPGVRRPLEDMVHHDTYDMSEIHDERTGPQISLFVARKTVPVYRNSIRRARRKRRSSAMTVSACGLGPLAKCSDNPLRHSLPRPRGLWRCGERHAERLSWVSGGVDTAAQ